MNIRMRKRKFVLCLLVVLLLFLLYCSDFLFKTIYAFKNTTKKSILHGLFRPKILDDNEDEPKLRTIKETRPNWMPDRMLTEPDFLTSDSNISTSKDTETINKKIILLWNDWFHIPKYGFNENLLWHYKCPYRNCILEENRSKVNLKNVDAILWHQWGDDQSFPNMRNLNAKLIYFFYETPQINKQKVTEKKFDLTMTYLSDSDIFSPSGFIVKRRKPLIDLPNNYNTKSKMIAWFVSKCHTPSNRETLVKTLQKFIPVDIYGDCGSFVCDKKKTWKCYSKLEREYFFYLSFENSLCEDYTTEKIFNILMYNVIPVVYGQGPYRKQFPEHSLIDVFDFVSIEELAKYLIYLSQNATAYNEYFRWKQYMKSEATTGRKNLALCDLCRKINQINSTNRDSKPNIDIEERYVSRSWCHDGRSEPINSFLEGKVLLEPYNYMLYGKRRNNMSFKQYSEYVYDNYNDLY